MSKQARRVTVTITCEVPGNREALAIYDCMAEIIKHTFGRVFFTTMDYLVMGEGDEVIHDTRKAAKAILHDERGAHTINNPLLPVKSEDN